MRRFLVRMVPSVAAGVAAWLLLPGMLVAPAIILAGSVSSWLYARRIGRKLLPGGL